MSKDTEWTDVEWITEEERADGILRLEPPRLVLEVEIVQSTTTWGDVGHAVDSESLGRHEIVLPFDQIASVRLQRRLWWPKIQIQTSTLKPLDGLPGAKRGVVSLRLKNRNWKAAQVLVNELEFTRADLEFRRAAELDDPSHPSLPPSSP
ncbi:MAG: hypothetical protein MJB57_15555 [Gemmatimonadetes bacterium]|nr:hypothetical protein [Gemmatimonadota bacterium]